MKTRFNPAKTKFLTSLPDASIDSHAERFKNNLSFNLHYFDSSQKAGINFAACTLNQLVKLMEKLRHFSGGSVEYWRNQRIGAGGLHVLEIYGDFPRNSDFTHPKSVPVDVLWARFRLENDVRLCGFLLPEHKAKEHNLRKNVFYIVFLDHNHGFYKLPQRK